MQNLKLPELLAPAGSIEALEAAIAGGADAVYLGGRLLNARMRAKNFDDEAMRTAVLLCHDKGVRIYVTLNTIVYDKEADEAVRYAAFLYEAGVDALIMTDLGLAQSIKKYMPDFELHASTQLSGHSSDAAIALQKSGFSRMVCARELSKENLSRLISESPIETEVFAHGAFCVSHSGQCLCSWALGGRSGNRGECAQPCRMSYNGGYPLSLRDNCLAGHIIELIDMGAASLKLEGRLKPPDYVYAVTKAYRTLLDQRRNANQTEIAELAKVFSRGGFTDGYFTGKIGQNMLGVRENNPQPVENSFHKPVKRRYEPYPTRISQCALPEGKIRFDSTPPVKINADTARFYYPDRVPDEAHSFFAHIYLPLGRYKKLSEVCDGVMLPPVITDTERESVKKLLENAYQNGARHVIAGNIGHIELAAQSGMTVHGDFRLNIANGGAAAYWSDKLTDYILSPELTLPQIRDITGAKAVIIYGRLPLMLLEKPVGIARLKGAKGEAFDIISEGGRDLLLNPLPIYMADKRKALNQAFAFNRHFIFTTESKREAAAIIEAYKKDLPPKDDKIKRIK